MPELDQVSVLLGQLKNGQDNLEKSINSMIQKQDQQDRLFDEHTAMHTKTQEVLGDIVPICQRANDVMDTSARVFSGVIAAGKFSAKYGAILGAGWAMIPKAYAWAKTAVVAIIHHS